MRELMLILALLNMLSCDFSQETNEVLHEIKINKIEEDKLSGFYIVKFNFLEREKSGSLICKIENRSCENKLIVGGNYQINLEKLESTEGITETSFRLNVNDIYIDGTLIFPKNDLFYKSSSITGLCVN